MFRPMYPEGYAWGKGHSEARSCRSLKSSTSLKLQLSLLSLLVVFATILFCTPVQNAYADDNLQYNYEVKFVNQPYSGCDTAVYVKTNNPKSDFNLSFYDSKGNKVESEGISTFCSDLTYPEGHPEGVSVGWVKVNGGYALIYSIDEPGTITVEVTETDDPSNWWAEKRSKKLGTIEVLDYDKAKNAWMDSVINKATDSSMKTKKEKMYAIAGYLYKNSKYDKNYLIKGEDNWHYSNLYADMGIPYFVSMEWNSYISPYMLVEFGKKIDYPLVSLYRKYPIGSADWKTWHWYAYSEADDAYFYCCKVAESNQSVYDSKADVPKFNFQTYSKYISLKPLPASANQQNSSNSSNTSQATKGTWKTGSKGWWYSCSDGSYAKGWKQIAGKWYYFNNSGWMQTGWQKSGGKWYYLNGSGAMATGWKKVGGKWYYLAPGNGAMKTGWYQVEGAWYYSNGSGVMKTGWQKISGKWYYMKSSGKMQTGKQTLKGKTYFLNKSGAMQTGWVKNGSAWYYCNGSGVMQVNKWIGNFYVQKDGSMATNSWVDGGKYYVGANGKWVRGAK